MVTSKENKTCVLTVLPMYSSSTKLSSSLSSNVPQILVSLRMTLLWLREELKITPQILPREPKCLLPTLQYNNTRNSSLWAPDPLPMKGRTKLELGANFLKSTGNIF